MKTKTNPDWPVLTHYDQKHLNRIALPLGGIGTGTVSLGGRGQLQDWEIVNRPAKGFSPDCCFFTVWAKPAGGEPVARCCEGAIPAEAYEGAFGAPANNHGLPRFRNCEFAAAYPMGQVMLSDPEMPVDVRLEAVNPMIPADADASGIPMAVLRYVVTNRTGKPVSASVTGSMRNFIGSDGSNMAGSWAGRVDMVAGCKENRNAFRDEGGVRGICMTTEGTPCDAPQWGTMALTTTAKAGVSYRTSWCAGGWGPLLRFWDDLIDDGKLTEDAEPPADRAPVGALCVNFRLAPRQSKAVTFMVTWHYPNRITWSPKPQEEASSCCEGDDACCSKKDPNNIGNYYCTQYADAWDVAVKTLPRLAKLEAGTAKFLKAYCASDLPQPVKEGALNNLSTLRSQTSFRTPDGLFFGFEGCGDSTGCCHGSCTHVWNYEHGTAFTFGTLAQTMREVEFAHATRDDGSMAFRVNLPIQYAQESALAAADGQMGCLMKLYRDWQLSGDDEMLKRLWPHARRAISFCWEPGSWDGDRDGVMEGCQHNTMDVNYFGPNPQMTGWYLGALRASEEMARYIGDAAFADTCRDLFEKGSKWMDEHLFNGEYYEHEIRPKTDPKDVNYWTCSGAYKTADDLKDPPYQLGAGCLVDQLVGQYTAHVAGLGYLHDPAKVKKTLQAIMKYNWRDSFYGHFNNMRSFVVNEESALLMASYPLGRRPKLPFPYFNEVMTGFEYTAAVGMLQEGMTAMGLKCIKAIRNRYDGRKRSPWDEAECGHHYARAMAAWAALTTLTGFQYSGVTGAITFARSKTPATWFWSTGHAWGTIRQKPGKTGVSVELTCLHGTLTCKTLTLSDVGTVKARNLTAGKTLKATVKK